ncbi:MAG: hypothetical protein Kow00124_09470 [Anaerolineae bacterium]
MPRKQTKTGKYKLKTHKATAKRFKLTGSGKLVRTKGPKGHFRVKQSKRSKHMLSEMVPVKSKGDQKRVRRLLPYIKKYDTRPSRPGSKSPK